MVQSLRFRATITFFLGVTDFFVPESKSRNKRKTKKKKEGKEKGKGRRRKKRKREEQEKGLRRERKGFLEVV